MTIIAKDLLLKYNNIYIEINIFVKDKSMEKLDVILLEKKLSWKYWGRGQGLKYPLENNVGVSICDNSY